MALPTTREQLKQWCLRELGEPVIQVNVDDKQVEDRIDEALSYFQDYHYDGTEKLYFKHSVTADNITNKYIELNDSIINVEKLARVGTNQVNMFDIKYQFSLQYVGNLGHMDMITYDMMKRHLSLIEEEFNPLPPIDFNRIQHKLNIYTNWEQVSIGDYFVIECYAALSPDDYAAVYKNRWIRQYLTELIRLQWGQNLSKYEKMELPGGIVVDGQTIREKAEDNLTKLREQVRSEFQLPIDFIVG
jgi:hypothetical protein